MFISDYDTGNSDIRVLALRENVAGCKAKCLSQKPFDTKMRRVTNM